MRSIFSRTRAIFVLCAFALAGDAFAADLVRPLSEYADSDLNFASRLTEKTYAVELAAAYASLGLPQGPSHLHPEDQMTVIATELKRLEPGFQGAHLGDWNLFTQATVERFAQPGEPLAVYASFARAFPPLAPESTGDGLYSQMPGRTYRELGEVATAYQFLHGLLDLQTHASEDDHPALDRAVEAAIALVRSELIYLDGEIKLTAQYDPDVAEDLAAATMAVLFSAPSVHHTETLLKILDGIDESFMINTRAHRFAARTIDWLHARLFTPVRKFSFVVTAAMIVGWQGYNLAPHASQDIKDVMMIVGGTTGVTWFSLWVENFLGGRAGATLAARAFDEALNRFNARILPSRQGALSRALGLSPEQIKLECARISRGAPTSP